MSTFLNLAFFCHFPVCPTVLSKILCLPHQLSHRTSSRDLNGNKCPFFVKRRLKGGVGFCMSLMSHPPASGCAFVSSHAIFENPRQYEQNEQVLIFDVIISGVKIVNNADKYVALSHTFWDWISHPFWWECTTFMQRWEVLGQMQFIFSNLCTGCDIPRRHTWL